MIDGYTTIDISLSHHRFLNTPGLTFSSGVNNLFDEDVRYTAVPQTYRDGLPQPGRSFWLMLNYDLD